MAHNESLTKDMQDPMEKKKIALAINTLSNLSFD